MDCKADNPIDCGGCPEHHPAGPPRIALHQNGFIKVELPKGRRLHVWSPYNPPGDPAGGTVHDHPFAFDSFVLGGSLCNITLLAVPINDDTIIRDTFEEFIVECASSFDDAQPTPRHTRRIKRLLETAHIPVGAGRFYSMEPWALHRTDAVLAVTIFEKGLQEPGQARLYVPPGKTPDQDWGAVHSDPETLWGAVHSALRDVGLTWDDVLLWNEWLFHLRLRLAGSIEDTTHMIREYTAELARQRAEAEIEYPADPVGTAGGYANDPRTFEVTSKAARSLADLFIMTDPMVQKATGLRAMTRNAGYIDVANAMTVSDFEQDRFQPVSTEEIDTISAMLPSDVLDQLPYVGPADLPASRRPTAAVVIMLSYSKGYLTGAEGAPEREVLTVKRKDSELLGVPGGKIEPGESALQAVVRELYEKTEIKTEPQRLRFVGTFHDGERYTACFLWDRRLTMILSSAWEAKTKALPTGVRWASWTELLSPETSAWPSFYAQVQPIVDRMAPLLPPAAIRKNYAADLRAIAELKELKSESEKECGANFHLTQGESGYTTGPTTDEPGHYAAYYVAPGDYVLKWGQRMRGSYTPGTDGATFAAVNAHRNGEPLPPEPPADVQTWAEIAACMERFNCTEEQARHALNCVHGPTSGHVPDFSMDSNELLDEVCRTCNPDYKPGVPMQIGMAQPRLSKDGLGTLVPRAEVERRLAGEMTAEEQAFIAKQDAEAFMPVVRGPDPAELAERESEYDDHS